MIWCIEVALLSARSNFLITFVGGLCLATVALSFRLRARDRNLAIGIAVLLMLASVALASYCLPDRNSLVNLLKNDKFATVLGGLSGLLAGLAIVQPEARGLHRVSAFALCMAIVGVCSLFLMKDASRSGPWGGTGQPSDPRPGTPGAGRVKIEEFASLDLMPICMTMDPEGRLYVSGLQGNVNAEGVIVRLERPESGGAVASRTVARGLVRPHGMAFHEGNLYVVRTGQLTTTEGDRIKFVPTGVVTRLTDVDGDGEYDLYRDVLTGLPGAFGLHSVSAITFANSGARSRPAPCIPMATIATMPMATARITTMTSSATAMRNLPNGVPPVCLTPAARRGTQVFSQPAGDAAVFPRLS